MKDIYVIKNSSQVKLLKITLLIFLVIASVSACGTFQQREVNKLSTPDLGEALQKQIDTTKIVKPPLGIRGMTLIYKRIIDVYPNKLNIKKLYINGLRGLRQYDSALNIKIKKRKVEIVYDSKVVESYDDPYWKSYFAIKWFYQILGDVKKHSIAIAKLSEREIELTLLNKSLQSISDHAAFFETADAPRNLDFSLFGISAIEFKNQLTITDVTDRVIDLVPGDIVKRINGVDYSKIASGNILDYHVFENRPVTLSIQSQNDQAQRSVILSEEVESIPPASFDLLSDEIAYFRVFHFYNGLASAVRYELEQWQTSTDKQPKGLIIDLRSSIGGVVNDIVALADVFLSQGIIATIRLKKETEEHKATPTVAGLDIPIVMLVDVGTTAGAELFVAALKDNQRAVVIGSNTAGRGMIHTVFPLHNGSALMTPSGYFYTSNNRAIEYAGIQPHICTANKANTSNIRGYSAYLGRNTKFCQRSLHLNKIDEPDLDLDIAIDILQNMSSSSI